MMTMYRTMLESTFDTQNNSSLLFLVLETEVPEDTQEMSFVNEPFLTNKNCQKVFLWSNDDLFYYQRAFLWKTVENDRIFVCIKHLICYFNILLHLYVMKTGQLLLFSCLFKKQYLCIYAYKCLNSVLYLCNKMSNWNCIVCSFFYIVCWMPF